MLKDRIAKREAEFKRMEHEKAMLKEVTGAPVVTPMAMQIKRGVEVLLYWNEQKKLKQEERMREEGRKLI
jgi:hypothetical protein